MMRMTNSAGPIAPPEVSSSLPSSWSRKVSPDADEAKYGKSSHLPSWMQPYLINIRRWLFAFQRLPMQFQIVISATFMVTGLGLCHWALNSASSESSSLSVQPIRRSKTSPFRPEDSSWILDSPKSNLQYNNNNVRSSEITYSYSFSPRVLQLVEHSPNQAVPLPTDELPQFGQRQLLEKYISLPRSSPRELKLASTMDKGKCQATAEWQLGHHPTCNAIHEASGGFIHPFILPTTTTRSSTKVVATKKDKSNNDDEDEDEENEDDSYLQALSINDPHEQLRFAAEGAFRSVYMIREFDGTRKALKTLRFESKGKEFDLRNFDRHRRDAVAMEQLTKSPLVVDIYGFCSNSGLFDWGEGGDLESIFDREPDISKDTLLKIAYNVSLSIHDAHNFDDRGRPTIAHTDIKVDQFLYQNGYYRLTDFNRVRFLLWNEDQNKSCPFHVGKNGGNWRSPEEYNYEGEREKVDVYSLGNVLYFLLVKEEPWKDYRNKEIYQRVGRGQRPTIPSELLESNHPFDKYVIEAIQMAWTHDQHKRPGALAVAQKLHEGIAKLDNYVEDSGKSNTE